MCQRMAQPLSATPGHIRDPILKWCTRPYPPVDVQRLAAPIRTHPEIRALSSGNGESQTQNQHRPKTNTPYHMHTFGST